jgi:Tfp pilus assembly pilus retraction ATPase PilT
MRGSDKIKMSGFRFTLPQTPIENEPLEAQTSENQVVENNPQEDALSLNLADDIREYFYKQTRTVEECLVWCTEHNCSDLYIKVTERPYISRYGKITQLPCSPINKITWSNFYELNVKKEYNQDYVREKLLDVSVTVRIPEDSPFFGKYESNSYKYRASFGFSQDQNQCTFRMIRPNKPTFDSINYSKQCENALHEAVSMRSGITLFTGVTGSGKELYKETIIPTTSGNKPLKDIEVGEILFDINGQPTKVIAKYNPPETKFYELTFSDGTKIKSGAGHLWIVECLNSKHNKKENCVKVLSTQQLVDIGVHSIKQKPNFAISRPKPCQYKYTPLPIKPYWLGAWIGNGFSDISSIWGTDTELFDRCALDYNKKSCVFDNSHNMCIHNYNVPAFSLVKNNKHIPDIYKMASPLDKMELLSGLIDTDGYVNKNGHIDIQLINKQAIETVREIACSLGIKCSPITEKIGKYKNTDETIEECQKVYRLRLTPIFMLPLCVPRKRKALENIIYSEVNQQRSHTLFYIEDIQEITGYSKDYYCLSVDSPTHSFLCTSSYIPTHNSTTMAACINTFTQPEDVLDNKVIITLEDPIENEFSNTPTVKIAQKELIKDFKSFALGIKAALREHPNMIIVGECRDKEVICAAIEAARTGHSVMSSFHAGDVGGTISRLLYHLDNDRNLSYDLIINLNLILSQTLIKNDNGYVVDTQYLIFDDEVTKRLLAIIDQDLNIAVEVEKMMKDQSLLDRCIVKDWDYDKFGRKKEK